MSRLLVQPQGGLSPAEALKLAQEAPKILRTNPKAFSSSPLVSLFTAAETADLWAIYENLLLSCLRTGDQQAAHQCLDRLVLRFGEKNEKIMALRGLVSEADAANPDELSSVLKSYEAVLEENPANVPIAKRRVALLKSMDRIQEAITALTSLLEFNPTDAEAWSELGDLYLNQGLYPQAIFALEEVLVLVPNAWNMHARLGEVLLMAAGSGNEASPKYLTESVKRFCRSIELCDDYLRGYYGLKKVTDQLLGEAVKGKKQSDTDGFTLPNQETVQKLNQSATKKLAEIVRRNGANEPLWQGYDANEVAAARELLGKTESEMVR